MTYDLGSRTPSSPARGAVRPNAVDERPYWRAIAAHPAVVILFVLAALAGGVLYQRLRSVQYQATARLAVTPIDAGQQGLQGLLGLPLIQASSDPTLTIQTAANAVRTPQIASAAAADLGPAWDAQKVLRAVSLTPQGQSNVLEVQATAGSAAEAKAVADSYAKSVIAVRNSTLDNLVAAYIAKTQQQLQALPPQNLATGTLQLQLLQLQVIRQTGDPTIAVLQLAELPTSSQGPQAALVLGLAALVGLVAGGAGAIAFDRLRPRVLRTEADLLAAYPLPVLARASLARRFWPYGARRRAATNQAATRALRDEIDRVGMGSHNTAVKENGGSGAHALVVTITSPSGGDGRTTLSRRLVAELQACDRSVVLVEPESNPTRRPGERSSVPEFIQTARQAAAYVIVDTLPLAESRDAALAASESDVVVLVARLGHTAYADAVVAREILERFGRPADGAFVVAGTRRWRLRDSPMPAPDGARWPVSLDGERSPAGASVR